MTDEHDENQGRASQGPFSFEASFRSFRRDLPSAVTGKPDPDGWHCAAYYRDLWGKEKSRAEQAEAERDAPAGIVPLDWVVGEDGLTNAAAVVGHYVLFPHVGRCDLTVGYGSSFETVCWRVDLNRRATEDELKAAALADHEERIRRQLMSRNLARKNGG